MRGTPHELEGNIRGGSYLPGRIMKLEELIQTAQAMLAGKEFEDFCYLEGPLDDPDWWTLRLYISRN